MRQAVPTAAEFITRACKAQDASTVDPRSKMLVGRIVTFDGRPANGARWKLVPPAGATGDPYAPQGYYAYGQTGADGMVFVCTRLIQAERVILQTWTPGTRGDAPSIETEVRLPERISATKVTLPP